MTSVAKKAVYNYGTIKPTSTMDHTPHRRGREPHRVVPQKTKVIHSFSQAKHCENYHTGV